MMDKAFKTVLSAALACCGFAFTAQADSISALGGDVTYAGAAEALLGFFLHAGTVFAVGLLLLFFWVAREERTAREEKGDEQEEAENGWRDG